MDVKKFLVAFGLAATTATFAAQYEAEDATLENGATVSSNANASGGKFVEMKGGDISFNVTAETAGKYTLNVRYKAGSEKTNHIVVNGSQSGDMVFATATAFTDNKTAITLKAGANTIAITNFWGWIDVDYIEITEYENVAFNICNAPVTPNATESAVKLYNFLVNNFQKKVISGIMTGDMTNYTAGAAFDTHPDVADIYTRSGKKPALVGLDFLFATGPNASGSWNKEYTDKGIALAKDLWKKGGIPAFTWHWKDPLDEVDAFYANQNAAGEGKEYTTFDFTEAFVKGTTSWDTLSAAYKGIIADIDYISEYFLDLQKDGVAAIFRPLHEAGGTWFWWSTHSGKQFAALYRLVYERMVFKNGVKNLVWVFNPQTANLTDWNPGETYYDVLSIDIYNNDNDNSSNAGAFDDFKAKFGVSKVLALSENGPIPDITKMEEDQAMWSWWMPWYSTWGGKWPGQTSNEVWKSNMENEKVLTIDKMPGWDNYTVANSGTQTCKAASEGANFAADTSKANGAKDYKMQVTYSNLTTDGALINFTKLPDLSASKSISVDIQVNGSSTAAEGAWIGLAFVRNGMEDKAWTWEQSLSDGCWIEFGGSKNCTFDITTYKDDDGVEHPIDVDNLFSVVFVLSAEGFTGNITFDNMVTDDEKIVSAFDAKKDLFSVSEGSEDFVKAIALVEDIQEPSAIRTVAAKASSARFSVQGGSIMLATSTSGNVAVDVFAMTGKLVATLFNGNLAAGTHAFSLADMPKGQYIVRVKGNGIAATQPVKIR